MNYRRNVWHHPLMALAKKSVISWSSTVTDRANNLEEYFYSKPLYIIGDFPMTGLTTHVLDTALGKPAEGLMDRCFPHQWRGARGI